MATSPIFTDVYKMLLSEKLMVHVLFFALLMFFSSHIKLLPNTTNFVWLSLLVFYIFFRQNLFEWASSPYPSLRV